MYWDPFDELERMHEEMDRLFTANFGPSQRKMLGYGGTMQPVKAGARVPVCHLHETESAIVAAFELPGVEKKDIDLHVGDKSIELKVESETKKEDRNMSSYSRQSYFRTIPLPKEVMADKAQAEYKDGVLRVEIPKKEKETVNRKRIDVK
ncbi:MAG: Hsp20/alpha crystallin family protein [Nanoarchaeota archaeon]|nr:Hsp20/alpha crystallin family protein [Nanoarchaeota archaeon]